MFNSTAGGVFGGESTWAITSTSAVVSPHAYGSETRGVRLRRTRCRTSLPQGTRSTGRKRAIRGLTRIDRAVEAASDSTTTAPPASTRGALRVAGPKLVVV